MTTRRLLILPHTGNPTSKARPPSAPTGHLSAHQFRCIRSKCGTPRAFEAQTHHLDLLMDIVKVLCLAQSHQEISGRTNKGLENIPEMYPGRRIVKQGFRKHLPGSSRIYKLLDRMTNPRINPTHSLQAVVVVPLSVVTGLLKQAKQHLAT